MISSIVVTGRHNIGVGSNNKIKVNDTLLSIEKEIPFIRYRFDSYNEDDIFYIKEMMNKFNYSTHLAEIKLSDSSVETLKSLEDNFTNLAKYIYIDITDNNVQSGEISADTLGIIDKTLDYTVDRYMLKDRSTSLDTITAKKIIKQLCTSTGLTEDMFGVCSSPLSFSEWACLTAIKARELMSTYSTIADVALPSANHQCMNCCGCIRYMIVDSDISAPSDNKVKKASKSKDTTKKQVAKKKAIPMGFGEFSL